MKKLLFLLMLPLQIAAAGDKEVHHHYQYVFVNQGPSLLNTALAGLGAFSVYSAMQQRGYYTDNSEWIKILSGALMLPFFSDCWNSFTSPRVVAAETQNSPAPDNVSNNSESTLRKTLPISQKTLLYSGFGAIALVPLWYSLKTAARIALRIMPRHDLEHRDG